MASVCLSASQNWSTAVWYLLITRHPSLYLSLRARPWLRISQSCCDVDTSDVDTTLMLFAAATAGPTLGSELAGTMLCGLQLLLSSVSHTRQLTFAPRTPAPPRKQLSRVSALAWVGYGGVYPGRGQMSSTSSDDGGAYSHAPLNM